MAPEESRKEKNKKKKGKSAQPLRLVFPEGTRTLHFFSHFVRMIPIRSGNYLRTIDGQNTSDALEVIIKRLRRSRLPG
jgi:hypothetical protein